MKSAVNKRLVFPLLLLAIMAVSVSGPEAAGVAYKDGDKYVKVGGRIQLQYHYVAPDSADAGDSLFFRRFRPYVEGSIHKDWKGKFQWDMGKAAGADADQEVAIKDAYMQYDGIEGIRITLGNAKFPFSREFITSSKYQQLVERTFVGDHDYGTPDRQLGVHLDGHGAGEKLTWAASVVSADIDPDKNKLDFDTPVNKADDFNEGLMVGGRVDYHPFGHLKFSQGDFRDELKATIGVAAFSWSNDNDNNTYTDSATGLATSTSKYDVDKITGVEVSGAFRYMGLSIDAEYNSFDADTVDGAVTGGIYKDGDAKLKNYAVEGGYMVISQRFEIVAGYQVQDADNYETQWKRTSVGGNWFFHKHDIKVQLTYRMGRDLKGREGNDEDEVFFQMQYVF